MSLTVGREIRKAREAAGLTQEELAFAARIHRTYVSLLERGVKSPTLEVLFKIARATGIPAHTIVRRIEKRLDLEA